MEVGGLLHRTLGEAEDLRLGESPKRARDLSLGSGGLGAAGNTLGVATLLGNNALLVGDVPGWFAVTLLSLSMF